MDADGDTSPPMSRIRVMRHHSPAVYSEENTPVAGPSRFPPTALSISAWHGHDEDEDAQSTPRVPVGGSILRDIDRPTFLPTPPGDTPARLRDVLARVPASRSGPSKLAQPQSPEPEAPSEFDSDFDLPNSMSVAPSFAQESLKELFSRALRDTPQKDRRRRNSIDASEVEQSPRLDRVSRARAVGKTKRKSLSDDELDKLSKSQDPPPKFNIQPSPRTSSAATFDALRQRLNNSQVHISDFASSTSSQVTISSTNTATLLRHLGSSTAVPPEATSTPHRTQASLQMPSHMRSHSNLMGHDSDMNKIMDLDSYDADSAAPLSFPPSNAIASPNGLLSTPPRKPSLSQASSSPVTAMIGKGPNLHRARQTSFGTLSSVSNAGSPRSDREFERERERGWNKPLTPSKSGTPDRSHALTVASLARHDGLSRRASNASLSNMSLDDGGSVRSRTTSLISDTESTRSRERGWNQPNPSLRPGLPRDRVTSQPLMPDSPGTPWYPGRHGHAGSPASVSSRSSSRASFNEHEPALPAVHERERNWNSPHPMWMHQSPGRPASFSPRDSPSPITAIRVGARPRTGSLQGSPEIEPGPSEIRFPSTGKRTPLRHALSSPAMKGTSPAGSPSRIPVSTRASWTSPSPAERRLLVFSARAETPDLSDGPIDGLSTNRSPGDRARLSSRFGWTFPRNKMVLPPFEIEDSPEESARELPPMEPSLMEEEDLVPTRPTTSAEDTRPKTPADMHRLSAPLSVDVPRSQTPLLSPGVNGSASPVSPRGSRRHKRASTEFSTAVGAILPRVQQANAELAATASAEAMCEAEGLHPSDEDDVGTPAAVPLQLGSPSSPRKSPVTLPKTPLIFNDEGHQDKLPSPRVSIPDPAVLPMAESPESPLSPALPTTPPRRASFSTSVLQFRTPSPPKNLPDLPPPPSSDDEHLMDLRLETPRHNGVLRETGFTGADLSSMKTPRPPGAWAATPAPAPQEAEPPRDASSMDWAGNSISSISFNPQAISSPASSVLPPMPSVDEGESTQNGYITPAVSFSRPGSSTVAPTPAPPGAWLPTPGSVRKSLYKVRFDVSESELSTAEESHIPRARSAPGGFLASSDGKAHAQALPSQKEEAAPLEKTEVGVAEVEAVEAATIKARPVEMDKAEVPLAPSQAPDPDSQNAHKVIRVLDAFGQEEPEAESAPEHVSKDDPTEPTRHPNKGKQTPNGASRNRSSMRILDAMGREVEEESPEPESLSISSLSEDDAPRSRAEALAIIRRNTADLRRELTEHGQTTPNVLTADNVAYDELQKVVDEGHVYREQLHAQLRTVSKVTEGVDTEYRPVTVRRESYSRGVARRIFINLLNPRVFCTLVVLQLAIFIAFHRFADTRAYDMFRTRYHDPFNPDVYLYPIKPDLLRPSMSTSSYEPSLSLSAIPDSIRRQGWTGTLVEVGSNTTALLADWQRSTWETWNTRTGRTVTTWPPT